MNAKIIILILILFTILILLCSSTQKDTYKHGSPINYDHETAYLMAQLSNLSYWTWGAPDYLPEDASSKCKDVLKDPSSLINCVLQDSYGLKMKGCSMISYEWLSSGFIAQNPKTDDIYIAFAGTHDWPTTFIDARSVWKEKVAYPEGTKNYAAQGFVGAYGTEKQPALNNMIHSRLDSIFLNKTKKPNIFITGHSLGAALSIICAIDLKNRYDIDPIVYTFGSPRIGNCSFSKYFNKLCPYTYRVFNTRDPIPHIPPYYIFDYVHTGKPIRYRLPNDGNDCCIGCPTTDMQIGHVNPDHLLKTYISLMKNIKTCSIEKNIIPPCSQ